MAKKNANKTTTLATAVNGALNWQDESARMVQAAKEKGGSRGDALAKLATYVAGDTDGAKLLRECAGEAGAQAFIEQPRNVLGKLAKLAGCVVAGTEWCSAAGFTEAGRRKEDASVAVALHSLGAGDERQKGIIAAALTRYPGGAGAQMPAALEACAFVGIVERKVGGARNAEYSIKDRARADLLLPRA